jgi:hemoglobin-like flavoprotein
MTPKQIEMIENSWDYIILNVSEAGSLFYQRLFELDPELKHLFKGDTKAQAIKLTSMITFLVHKLNQLDEVVKDVRSLGARHKGYQVKPESYATVGAALLWTLEQGLGNQWNSEMHGAWAELYTVLSSIMIES